MVGVEPPVFVIFVVVVPTTVVRGAETFLSFLPPQETTLRATTRAMAVSKWWFVLRIPWGFIDRERPASN